MNPVNINNYYPSSYLHTECCCAFDSTDAVISKRDRDGPEWWELVCESLQMFVRRGEP